MSEIKKGNVVKLRTGGPLMTVEYYDRGRVQCVWFSGGPQCVCFSGVPQSWKLCRVHVESEALEIVSN